MNPTTTAEAAAVADVAAKLTEAQREVVLEALPWVKGSDQSGPWHAARGTIRALYRKGVCVLNGMFTPLGLPVRQHLEQGATAGVVGGKE